MMYLMGRSLILSLALSLPLAKFGLLIQKVCYSVVTELDVIEKLE